MGDVTFELLPEDRSRITSARWYVSAWLMRLVYWIMPRGDARDALGRHIGMWLSDCRLQWTLRYRPTIKTTEDQTQ
jgi:hypothetical protein